MYIQVLMRDVIRTSFVCNCVYFFAKPVQWHVICFTFASSIVRASPDVTFGAGNLLFCFFCFFCCFFSDVGFIFIYMFNFILKY